MADKISTDSDIMAAIVKNDEDQRAEIERLRAMLDAHHISGLGCSVCAAQVFRSRESERS